MVEEEGEYLMSPKERKYIRGFMRDIAECRNSIEDALQLYELFDDPSGLLRLVEQKTELEKKLVPDLASLVKEYLGEAPRKDLGPRLEVAKEKAKKLGHTELLNLLSPVEQAEKKKGVKRMRAEVVMPEGTALIIARRNSILGRIDELLVAVGEDKIKIARLRGYKHQLEQAVQMVSMLNEIERELDAIYSEFTPLSERTAMEDVD